MRALTGWEKSRSRVGPGFTGCEKTHVLYPGKTLVGPSQIEITSGLRVCVRTWKAPDLWWEPPASAGGAGVQSSEDAFYLSRMGITGCGKTLVFEGYGL